jgi:hypothetical protein
MTGRATRIITALLASVLATAAAAGPDRRRADAAYDLHFVTLMEDHGLVGGGDPEVLAATAMTIIEARLACRTGNHERGLKLYEAVPLGKGPVMSLYPLLPR